MRASQFTAGMCKTCVVIMCQMVDRQGLIYHAVKCDSVVSRRVQCLVFSV